MNPAPNAYSSSALTPKYTPPTYTSTPASSYGTGFSFLNLSLTTWIIIILILAILGFNIFVYLAQGTQQFSGIVGPYVKFITGLIVQITSLIGRITGYTTKTITNTSATGTKATVDVAAGTINTGVDVVGNTVDAVTGATASSSLKGSQTTGDSVQKEDVTQSTPLNNAIKNKNASAQQEPQQQTQQQGIKADASTSTIQSNKSSSKSGWCYIGEERGFRSCIEVGNNDNCASGNIYSSQEICMNPNLR
jgi:hypothetical protein